MVSISKSSKNLIFVSFIFSGMVFWLGSHYLSDALSHFSSSVSLQRSVAPEKALFELSKSLDAQRHAVQRILVESRQFSEDREALSDLSHHTKMLFNVIRSQILLSTTAGKNKLHHRYGQESLEALIKDMDDSFKRMSITRSILRRQASLALTQRDENLRMKLFDAYSSLVKLANDIRITHHGLPDKNYIDVLTAHDKKNAIWELAESINQTSTLLENYLLKTKHASDGNLNKENLELRILQQHERANHALTILSKLSQQTSDAGTSGKTVSALQKQYQDVFRLEAENILLANPRDLDSIDDLSRWNKVSVQTKAQLQLLIDASLNYTMSTAASIRGKAIVNLVSSLLIVLFCLTMGYITHKIARRVQHQADYDELTDLPNRRYFHDALGSLINKTNVSRNEKLVLMTLDLNGFKAINDTLGHIAGDELLKQVGARLHNAGHNGKLVARMGGDEFAVAFKFENATEPYQFACNLREAFATSFNLEDSIAEIDTSIGYSIYPDDAANIRELQKTSDFAMYSAKHAGKKEITPFDREIANQLEKRTTIERDLPKAIDNDELELYYQPQISLAHDEVYSVEALIRWNHPQRGLVSPFEFVGIAEESGLMPALGNWVLIEACKQAAEWNNQQNLSIRVAVNVSVHQITQADFVDNVLNAIERYNLPACFLELEITESVVMSDIEWIVSSLNQLKEHGVRIALDDFGTGYSSLNQLQALPLDTLKIDRSFISKIDDDTVSMKSITATIASIAEIYGLETVAEGIETEQQLVEVKRLGIDVAQGYYYSRPVARDEVAQAIANIDQLAAGTMRKAA